MNSRHRTVLAAGIILGFCAGALLGYFARWVQDARSAAPMSSATRDSTDGGAATSRAPPAAIEAAPQESLGTLGESLPGNADSPLVGSLRRLASLSPAELMEMLRSAAESHDTQGFWLAAAALGPLGPIEIVEVAAMLRDSRKDLQAAELFFGELVRYGGGEGLDWIAEFVNDVSTDPRLRNTAVEALGGIPAARRAEAAPILEELLKSGLRFDEIAGAQTLGRLLGPEAVPGLIAVIDWWVASPDGSTPLEKDSWDELNVLNNVAKAIEDFATADDINLLAELFRLPLDRGIHALVCQIMSHAAGAEATETMLDLLLHPPEGAIRDVIAETLGKSAGRDDVPRLRDALQAEGDARVQTVLASVLARLAGVEEMRPLVQRALDPASGLSSDVLIDPLIRAKDKDMAPLLLDLVPSVQGEYAVCRLARGVLDLLGREEGAEKLLSIVEEGGDYRMASEVARALLEKDPDHDPGQLVALMERFTDGVHRSAIADVLKNEREAYGSPKGNDELIPGLVRILAGETDPGSQEHIASAIASFGPEGRNSLGEFLASDADPRRRMQVLRSLTFLPPQDTVALARRVLHEDPSPDVRSEAARILGTGNDPSLLQDLSSALATEEDPDVRRAIEAVLRRQGRP